MRRPGCCAHGPRGEVWPWCGPCYRGWEDGDAGVSCGPVQVLPPTGVVKEETVPVSAVVLSGGPRADDTTTRGAYATAHRRDSSEGEVGRPQWRRGDRDREWREGGRDSWRPRERSRDEGRRDRDEGKRDGRGWDRGEGPQRDRARVVEGRGVSGRQVATLQPAGEARPRAVSVTLPHFSTLPNTPVASVVALFHSCVPLYVCCKLLTLPAACGQGSAALDALDHTGLFDALGERLLHIVPTVRTPLWHPLFQRLRLLLRTVASGDGGPGVSWATARQAAVWMTILQELVTESILHWHPRLAL